MKKIIYTAAFFSLLAVAGKAQNAPQDPKKQNQAAEPAKKEDKASPSAAPKSGTRMAINEKGVPASKANNANKDKKEEKPVSPGQPVSNEKQ